MREGWKRIRLQNVCDRVTVGHVGKTSAYYCDDGVKFLRTQNVGKNGLKLNDVRFITPEFHRSLKKSQLAAGDVLISRVVTDDMRCAIVPPGLEPANCANIILLRPGSDLNSRYLYHLVNSPYAQRYLLDRRVGSAQQVVNTKVLKDWEIPVPSRGEQEKIVDILDEAFAGIATAVANTEKNLANARELFESYLNVVFSRRGDGWPLYRIGDVFRTATGNTPPKRNPGLYGNAIPFVKPPELLGGPIQSASDGLSKEGAVQGRVLPEKSVLVSCIGNLGKIGINTVPVAFNQQINAILPNEDKALPEFVYYQSLSRLFRDQLGELASGTTVPIVNKSKFNSVQVVLPEKAAQESIVERLREIQKQTQELETVLQRKAESLAELKQSLLEKAFSGELTTAPQDELETALA